MPFVEHLLAARHSLCGWCKRRESPSHGWGSRGEGQVHQTAKPNVTEGPKQPAIATRNINSLPPVVLLLLGVLPSQNLMPFHFFSPYSGSVQKRSSLNFLYSSEQTLSHAHSHLCFSICKISCWSQPNQRPRQQGAERSRLQILCKI